MLPSFINVFSYEVWPRLWKGCFIASIFVIIFTYSFLILPYPFSDIRNWIRNIEQHASDNVNKILVGNKADMDESKRVCYILP